MPVLPLAPKPGAFTRNPGTCPHCGAVVDGPRANHPRHTDVDLVIALVGNPNCGKSTLFNALTNSHSATVNAPGTTVELHRGKWRHSSEWMLVDLPGTYSLIARSPDEKVATDAVLGKVDLLGHKHHRPANALPGARQRSPRHSKTHSSALTNESEPSSLSAQSRETEIAEARRPRNSARLSSCPKCTSDTTRIRTETLPDSDGTRPDLVIALLDASALARSLVLLAQVLATGVPVVAAVTMLDVAAARAVEPDLVALADAAGVPVVAVNPRTGTGIEALTEMVSRALADPKAANSHPALTDPDSQFSWVDSVLSATLPTAPLTPVHSHSDRIDSILLHPIAGIFIFLGIMWGLLELTAVAATPLIEAVGNFFAGPVTNLVVNLFSGWAPNWFVSLLTDGIITGVGTVLSFAPLLALIFLAIGVLEDSGYLARAAFIADRGLRNIGLDGRAMMPLVVGFGCNVPAVTATKAMPDARQRLLTGLLIPLAACPARLTVFVLIAGAFFPGQVGTVVFLLYLFSIILIILGGLLLKATAFRDLSISRPLILALPAYQTPRIGWLLRSAGSRVAAFVRGAGGIIAGVLVVVWFLTAIPVTSGYSFGEVAPQDSLYGRVASAAAPVLEPAGLNDWRISSSLLTGFVAKEVVVGNLAQAFGTADPSAADYDQAAEVSGGSLADRLHATLTHTSGGHPQAAAVAFLVIVLAYTPCVATVAEQKRNFGWKWTLISLVGQLALAWLLGVAVFQVGRLLA